LIDFTLLFDVRAVDNNLQKPEKDSWGSGLEAMEVALELEKHVNHAILKLHQLASSHEDPHVS